MSPIKIRCHSQLFPQWHQKPRCQKNQQNLLPSCRMLFSGCNTLDPGSGYRRRFSEGSGNRLCQEIGLICLSSRPNERRQETQPTSPPSPPTQPPKASSPRTPVINQPSRGYAAWSKRAEKCCLTSRSKVLAFRRDGRGEDLAFIYVFPLSRAPWVVQPYSIRRYGAFRSPRGGFHAFPSLPLPKPAEHWGFRTASLVRKPDSGVSGEDVLVCTSIDGNPQYVPREVFVPAIPPIWTIVDEKTWVSRIGHPDNETGEE